MIAPAHPTCERCGWSGSETARGPRSVLCLGCVFPAAQEWLERVPEGAWPPWYWAMTDRGRERRDLVLRLVRLIAEGDDFPHELFHGVWSTGLTLPLDYVEAHVAGAESGKLGPQLAETRALFRLMRTARALARKGGDA